MHHQLTDAIRTLEQNPAVHCLMIQAEGTHFCTGADLHEVTGLRHSAEQLEIFLRTGLETFRRLRAKSLARGDRRCRGSRLPAGWS